MNANSQRRFWQIHRFTAIALIFVACGVFWINIRYVRVNYHDYSNWDRLYSDAEVEALFNYEPVDPMDPKRFLPGFKFENFGPHFCRASIGFPMDAYQLDRDVSFFNHKSYTLLGTVYPKWKWTGVTVDVLFALGIFWTAAYMCERFKRHSGNIGITSARPPPAPL